MREKREAGQRKAGMAKVGKIRKEEEGQKEVGMAEEGKRDWNARGIVRKRQR